MLQLSFFTLCSYWLLTLVKAHFHHVGRALCRVCGCRDSHLAPIYQPKEHREYIGNEIRLAGVIVVEIHFLLLVCCAHQEI